MDRHSRIYVAGHTGLFGTATVRHLQREGYENIICRTHDELDLARQEQVEKFFAQEKPEYVFMMCGKVGGIQENITHMAELTMENLKMSINLIEASHMANVKKLLYLGSSCMYPPDCPQPVREEYLLTGGFEPTNEGYALAKVTGLKACAYYHRQYGDCFISCIPANVYGPGDSFDEGSNHVIPALLRRFHRAKLGGAGQVQVWGSGRPQRDFLYIDDAVAACVRLMEVYDGDALVNVGTGKSTSIREVAEAAARVVGYEGEIVFDTSKPDGMMLRSLHSKKIFSMGWHPSVALEEGLARTYRWYLENGGERE